MSAFLFLYVRLWMAQLYQVAQLAMGCGNK